MRTKRIVIMITILFSMVATNTFAYDIAVENEEGVTIYYKYINGGRELCVTYKDDIGNPSYSGGVVIPSEITTNDGPRDVTSIGDWAFGDCRSLTSVAIPNSVTSIGRSAFEDCSGLTSVTIPNSVTSIGEYAFRWCSGFTSVTIPNSVTSIGKYAFNSCSILTSIVVESGNSVYDSRNNCNAIIETATNTLIQGCNTTIIPNSVTSIDISAFEDCGGLTSVVIPNSVTAIGKYAFEKCRGLKSITIGNSVTSIGDGAFLSCINLTSVTIPNRVTSIGENAFGGCSGLTSITIPNSVTSIGRLAFQGCNGLTSIVVKSDNSVYDSRNDCNAIIETQTNKLIRGCMTTTIPNSVTSIDDYAFALCSGLTSVTIPNSVISIGQRTFDGCSGLTSFKVEGGNSVYDSRNDCNAIIETATNTLIQGCNTTIIPNSVTSIGNFAFASCHRMTSITIPNSVTSIGIKAFDNCSSLTTVVSLIKNPFEIYGEMSPEHTFYTSTFENATLHVPQGTIEMYQATKGWKDFLHIEELNSSNMCATPTISYQNGTLSFYCATEGAMFQYSITDSDIKKGSAQEVNLDVTYIISVYATKDGYFDSETATATLCWIEANPQNEAIATDVNQIAAVAVLIKANGGQLTIEGANDNTTVTAYTLDGVQLGSAVSRNGVATINTNVSAGTVTIVKIGSKSVKIVMQ